MNPVTEIFRFVFDLTKIILIIIALLILLFVLAAVVTGLYEESVYACPDGRVHFTDEEAISFAKNYLESNSFDRSVTTSMDYNNTYGSDRTNRYGWSVSRKPPSNVFQAEEIELNFSGREDDAFVGCSMLACGVMLGCDRNSFSPSE